MHELINSANRIESQLFIKYKLIKHPTDKEIAKWYEVTISYIESGFETEDAARRAANDVFETDPRIVRKSQTDTIEALLAMAKKKVT